MPHSLSLGEKPKFGEKINLGKISIKLSCFQCSEVGVGREHPKVGLAFIDDNF